MFARSNVPTNIRVCTSVRFIQNGTLGILDIVENRVTSVLFKNAIHFEGWINSNELYFARYNIYQELGIVREH